MDNKKKTSLKTNKKPKKVSKQKAAEVDPAQLRADMIQMIVEKTSLTEDEIFELEEKFKEEYPDGQIGLNEFNQQSQVETFALLKFSLNQGI